jgi:hypothetical protein
MAFTTRSIRDISFGNHSTPSHVGPGSYQHTILIDPTSHLKLTSTPFSSTQRRITPFAEVTDSESDPGPGPGSYFKPEKVRKRKVGSTAFKSKTERFDPTRERMKLAAVPGLLLLVFTAVTIINE